MNLEEIKQFLSDWMRMNSDSYYALADKIWETPELSMQEHRSSQVLIEHLKDNGFHVDEKTADMPTSFIATYGCGKPVIGINVEFDALPSLSQDKNASVHKPLLAGAPGHGCGHNLLGVAMVKAGIALKIAMERFHLPGTIKLFGVPAEEMCLGKAIMGKAGYFQDVDIFLDWHPWNYNRADYDSCNAYFSVKYHYKGRSTHGNSPWHGRSALDAAILQSTAVEFLREHIPPGLPPDAANTINYTFSDTGSSFPSVIPDVATAWYVGRFTTTDQLNDAFERVNNCAKGAALATDTMVEIEVLTMTNHKIPNQVLAEVVHRNFEEIGPPEYDAAEQNFAYDIQRNMNAEESGIATTLLPFDGGNSVVCDTSEYSWNAPYATAWIAMGPQGIGWHNWGITACAGNSIGKKALDKAAHIISASAIDLLLSKETVEMARQEFHERLEGRTYRCLLPDDYDPPITLNEDVMAKYSME